MIRERKLRYPPFLIFVLSGEKTGPLRAIFDQIAPLNYKLLIYPRQTLSSLYSQLVDLNKTNKSARGGHVSPLFASVSLFPPFSLFLFPFFAPTSHRRRAGFFFSGKRQLNFLLPLSRPPLSALYLQL